MIHSLLADQDRPDATSRRQATSSCCGLQHLQQGRVLGHPRHHPRIQGGHLAIVGPIASWPGSLTGHGTPNVRMVTAVLLSNGEEAVRPGSTSYGLHREQTKWAKRTSRKLGTPPSHYHAPATLAELRPLARSSQPPRSQTSSSSGCTM